MQYRPYGKLGYQVSALGLGCMRLPLQTDANGNVEVNREKAYELIRYAIDHGINYIDTALTYHSGKSEEIVGEALDGGYRERTWIATKQMFQNIKIKGELRRNLENTLRKLRTSYLDCYLIHNIQSGYWEDLKRSDILNEYEKFRQEGLIRHIGFSYHGGFEAFSQVLRHYAWDMCQIQQNFLDIDHEATEEAIHLAGKHHTALVIMEPLRGGGLATPPPAIQTIYDEYPVQRSPVEWAFRHLINYPEVSCILSGINSLEQLKQNIAIFSQPDAQPGCMTQQERYILEKAKLHYESFPAIPCTGCEYCMPCPQGISIPTTFKRYNEGVMYDNFMPSKRWYMMLKRFGSDVNNCIACGACERQCPQHIPIIEKLREAQAIMDGWEE